MDDVTEQQSPETQRTGQRRKEAILQRLSCPKSQTLPQSLIITVTD